MQFLKIIASVHLNVLTIFTFLLFDLCGVLATGTHGSGTPSLQSG